MFNKISDDPPTIIIYRDVSDTGYGAHFQGRNTGVTGHLKKNIIT